MRPLSQARVQERVGSRDPQHPGEERPRPRRVWTLLAPLGATAVLWLVLLAATSRRVATDLLWAGLAGLFVGSTVIFGPAILPDIRLSTWELAALIAYLNVLTGLVYAYNLDILERVPGVGPYLERARTRAGARVRKRPWVRRLATLVVGLFVVLPVPGSGSLGGCIVGRVIGLSALRCFLTVSVAGVVLAVASGLAGGALKAWLDAEEVRTPFRIAAAAVVIAIVWLLVHLLRRLGAPEEAASD